MRAKPRAESGHGIAALLVALPALGLGLLARACDDLTFVLVAGWGALFAAVSLGLGLRAARTPKRRKWAALVGAVLAALALLEVALLVPSRDPLGRTWAMFFGAGALFLVILAGMALDGRRARLLAREALALGLAAHGSSFRGERAGARVKVDAARGRVEVSAKADAGFGLEVSRRLGRGGGDRSGDPAFDEELLVMSRPDAGRELLGDALLRDDLLAFFTRAVDASLDAQQGTVTVGFAAPWSVGELGEVVDAAAALCLRLGELSHQPGQQSDGVVLQSP
jgi:hypothetical protein